MSDIINQNLTLNEVECDVLVVGSGAAGYNAAARLAGYDKTKVILVTENRNSGTSRNTGSDKQTYYKLSLAGSDQDSVATMANDLYSGGSVDGDVALCEAAFSARSFYRLIELGIPFPSTSYGEYIGYQTDHDHGRRATSVGPYTSKIMTQQLEKEALRQGVLLWDHYQVISILTHDSKACGLLCLDTHIKETVSYQIFWASQIVYATGGPAGMYADSVYPTSQLGGSGLAFLAGVQGQNLTEWQYGLASCKPRWNVSGTYMQVLPRVISRDSSGGDEKEFLMDYFQDKSAMLSLLFLKGYQWPFDTAKVMEGSSIIDLLVYEETVVKQRHVYLDFRSNAFHEDIAYETLSSEAYEYLNSVNACFGTPIKRLASMNQPAIDFYLDHGINLYEEPLEIAICAQHNNGGLSVDAHWQTKIQGLYAAGEVAGTHGITRPGGSALNAGQVGSTRAAEHIHRSGYSSISDETKAVCRRSIHTTVNLFDKALHEQCPKSNQIPATPLKPTHSTQSSQSTQASKSKSLGEGWRYAAKRMSQTAGMIRHQTQLKASLEEIDDELQHFTQRFMVDSVSQAKLFYRLFDMLCSQKIYISAMLDYIEHGGKSRGSALYVNPDGIYPSEALKKYAFEKDNQELNTQVQEASFLASPYEPVQCLWRHTRPLPSSDYVFETEWKNYRSRQQ